MASGHDNLVSEPLTMASDADRVLRVTCKQPSSSTQQAAATPLPWIAKKLMADVLELKAMLKASNAAKKVVDGCTEQEVAEQQKMAVSTSTTSPLPQFSPPEAGVLEEQDASSLAKAIGICHRAYICIGN
uniref:Uncharacterized protein n=1 Tax=Oryza glumipatula TaxID=40148 RepID=A0A0D9ZW17_9ORYZ